MPGFTGSELCPTSAGTLAITGLGFTPNLIFFTGGDDPDPQARTNGYANIMFGAAALQPDSTVGMIVANMYVATTVNPNPKSSDSKIITTHCVHTYSAEATTRFSATLQSFDSDGFTLNFDVVDGTARRIFFTAYDIPTAQFRIGTLQSGASGATPGTVTVSGLDMAPETVIFLSADASTGEHISYGVDTEANKFSVMNSVLDDSLDASGFRHLIQAYTGHSMTHLWDNFNLKLAGSISNRNTDGFDVLFDRRASDHLIGYIALAKCDAYADFITETNAAVGSTSVITSAGFAPDAVLGGMVNGGFDTNPFDGSSTLSILALGGGDRNLNQNSYGYQSSRTGANSYTVTREGTEAAISRLNTSFYDFELVAVSDVGFSLRWDAIASTSSFWYLLLRENPDLADVSGPQLIENDMELGPGQTHFMVVGHRTSGVAPSQWTKYLLKNGERINDIEIEVVENPSKVYTFSFTNDSTHDSQWQLVVWETASDSTKYNMAWKVYKKIVEQTVKQLRSRMDSDGGFFNPGNE